MNNIINIENGCIQSNVEYKVVSGTIQYNGITYNAGDIFVGIEDLPYYDETVITDLIPDMTSNTSPSGMCFGDGVYRNYAQYNYWKAFNKSVYDNNDNWLSLETVDKPFPHWIGYKFEECVICNKFIVQTRIGDHVHVPKKIKIEASNNYIDWVELYKFNELDFPDKKYRKCYNFFNNTAYMYYRLFIEEGYSDTYVGIGELTMLYETTPNAVVTTVSKIQHVLVEYENTNNIKKYDNKFSSIVTEYEIAPYNGKYNIDTQFKNLSITIPTNPEYGEVLKVSNIRMFKTPLRGNQKYNESNY